MGETARRDATGGRIPGHHFFERRSCRDRRRALRWIDVVDKLPRSSRLDVVRRRRSRDMLRPRDTIEAHKASVAYIERTLAEPFEGDTTVLITHHPVSVQSLRGYDPAPPD